MSRLDARVAQIDQLLSQGRAEQAEAVARRLAQSSPRDAQAQAVMARLLLHVGKAEQAMHFARMAAGLAPDDADLALLEARLLTAGSRHADAERALRRALKNAPERGDIAPELAGVLMSQRRFTECEAFCREQLAQRPDDVGVRSALAGCLLNLGRIEEVTRLMRELRRAYPDNAGIAGGLALMLNYLPGATPRDIFEAHREYGTLLPRVEKPGVYASTHDPERRLRVGIISPDLRAHSVAYFIEPFIAGHDRAAIDLVVYQTNRIADAVTERLRGSGVAWKVADRVSDEELAEEIRRDAIDIAVELSGHTHANSLPAMALRPAPVQVTYLGYPNTTGVFGIDWRVVDSITDPPGAERFATERLWRLDPCFLCYRPDAGAPAVAPPPVATRGYVTFGSFNTVHKINREVVTLWTRLVRAVPESRLVLKSVNFADEALRRDVEQRFRAAGAPEGRVRVLPPAGAVGDHLRQYAEIDVALDPFPYAGTTTTCEALWMGVPVVTLAGDTHASRVGASLLRAAGHPELVAYDAESYVRTASGLAAAPSRLVGLRSGLRASVEASSLRDEAGFCRRFEGALRAMWREYCRQPTG